MFQRLPETAVLILFISSAKFISSAREIPSKFLGSKMYFPWINTVRCTYRDCKVQDYTSMLYLFMKEVLKLLFTERKGD